jgi:hypothetical protein
MKVNLPRPADWRRATNCLSAAAIVLAALALAFPVRPSDTNRVERWRAPADTPHKGAELMMRPAASNQPPPVVGTLPGDSVDVQRSQRGVPPLPKAPARFGFGDRGQSYDPVLGRPPGMILFSVSF